MLEMLFVFACAQQADFTPLQIRIGTLPADTGRRPQNRLATRLPRPAPSR